MDCLSRACLGNFRVSKKQMKTRRLQLSRRAAARTRTRTGATATAPAWTAAARKRRSLQCDENGLFSRASFPLRLKGTRSPAKTGSGQTCTCIQRKTQQQPRQRIVCFVLFCFVLFCFVLAGGRHAHRPAFAAGHLPNRHLLLRNLATGRHAARRKQWRGDIAPRCGEQKKKRPF